VQNNTDPIPNFVPGAGRSPSTAAASTQHQQQQVHFNTVTSSAQTRTMKPNADILWRNNNNNDCLMAFDPGQPG